MRVDGKDVGAGRNVEGRRQWTPLATRDFGPGAHRVEVERGGGSLAPGNGSRALSVVGPVAFVPAGRPVARLRELDPRDARSLCGGSYDWLEILRA